MKRALIFLLSISLGACAWAQGSSIPKSEEARALERVEPDELPDSVAYRYPLWHGMSVSVNVFPPMMQLFGKDYANYEAMLTLDLHHRFMPQVVAGMGGGEATNDNGLTYKSNTVPYLKVGMAYNFNYNDTQPDNFYAVFARYAFSSSKGDISGMSYTDGYWDVWTPEDLEGLQFNAHWLEIGGMIKVRIAHHISMGWEGSFKPFVHKGGGRHGDPYFVPGYGVTTSKLGFGFHVFYDL